MRGIENAEGRWIPEGTEHHGSGMILVEGQDGYGAWADARGILAYTGKKLETIPSNALLVGPPTFKLQLDSGSQLSNANNPDSYRCTICGFAKLDARDLEKNPATGNIWGCHKCGGKKLEAIGGGLVAKTGAIDWGAVFSTPLSPAQSIYYSAPSIPQRIEQPLANGWGSIAWNPHDSRETAAAQALIKHAEQQKSTGVLPHKEMHLLRFSSSFTYKFIRTSPTAPWILA